MEQHTSESFENLEPADRMKYEIAEELGLLEKVRKGGWKALSSRETGQIWRNGEQKKKGSGEGAENKIKTADFATLITGSAVLPVLDSDGRAIFFAHHLFLLLLEFPEIIFPYIGPFMVVRS